MLVSIVPALVSVPAVSVSAGCWSVVRLLVCCFFCVGLSVVLSVLLGAHPASATAAELIRLTADFDIKDTALRVALIGIEPRPGQKLFSADMLSKIDRLSTQLKNTTGVDRVVSPTTINDLVPIEGGVDLTLLVPQPIPTDEATLAKVRARALSQPTIRGNVVSADGEAGLIMVFVGDGVPTRLLAEKAQSLAHSELDSVAKLYFGGAPFAGQAIYDDTQRDVQRLVPIALLLFLLVVLLAFRDGLSVMLTVGTVGLSVLLSVGLLGLHGDKFTVVMGTLPLVLFASGSQYAIHILGRYSLIRESSPSLSTLEAAREALTVAGPPVIVAALNCCVGFLSFLVMNISAMRAFGVACCIGVIACCAFSVTVAPSMVARFQSERPPSEVTFTRLGELLNRQFAWVRRHRALVTLFVIAVSTVCGFFMTRVQVRMEPKAFFRPGSEPALAQKFLDEKFGGAAFVQVLVEGDMTDPRALHEVRRLSALSRSLPGVTQVQTIVQPLAMVGDSMAGLRGLPENAQQVVALLFFLEGEPSLRTMLASDRRSVLVHARVLGDAGPAIASLPPSPSTMTVFSLPMVMRLALPRSVSSMFSSLMPRSSEITVPPVTTAVAVALQAPPQFATVVCTSTVIGRGSLITKDNVVSHPAASVTRTV